MVFPKQTLTVQDPGIPLTAIGTALPLITGVSVGGSQAVKTIGQINDINQVRSVVGYGPLAEDVALTLQKAGGPVNFVRHNVTGSALSAQTMTQVGSGESCTLSGTPNDRYGVMVTVIAGGARGTATFQYSLDNWQGDAAAKPLTVPTQSNTYVTAATFPIPHSGLTINFATGSDYVAGDTFFYETTPGEVGTSDLGDVQTALLASPSTAIALWLLSGTQVDKTTAGTLAAAFEGDLETLATGFRYARGFVDIGSGDVAADVVTEALSWTGVRVVPAYGYEYCVSSLPFEGYTVRKVSCITSIAVRAFSELISSDLSRTAGGACSEVLAIAFDGFQDNSMDSAQISTMRTWLGFPGFYIAGAKLKCSAGSDFTDLQFGRVMDQACQTTFAAQFPYISSIVRATKTGTVDPRDAHAIEQVVQGALNDALAAPVNASGTAGHVSAVSYAVSLTNNIVTTSQLVTSVAIVPLGYAKLISTTLAFSISAG